MLLERRYPARDATFNWRVVEAYLRAHVADPERPEGLFYAGKYLSDAAELRDTPFPPICSNATCETTGPVTPPLPPKHVRIHHVALAGVLFTEVLRLKRTLRAKSPADQAAWEQARHMFKPDIFPLAVVELGVTAYRLGDDDRSIRINKAIIDNKAEYPRWIRESARANLMWSAQRQGSQARWAAYVKPLTQ